ncbi:aspartate aminotransferase family protein, partial [Pseudomonas sp. MWU13-2625]
GAQLLRRLREELATHPAVREIRGLGLMVGIELRQPARELVQVAAREHRLLINVTRGTTIRLLPPLVIDGQEVEMIVDGLRQTLKAL